MKRFIPNTIFARLFALVVLAIVVSHLATFAVMFAFHEERIPPPFDQRHEATPPVHFESMSGRLPPAHAWINNASSPSPHNMMPPPKRPPFGLWVGLIIQFIALTIAAWFGARILARPIQRQARAAAQLGATLNSPLLDEQDGPVEARQAAQVFNQMQQRIRSHIEERERFLAAVSHDLRTPLTRMQLRLERFGEHGSKDKLTADINEMVVMLDATLDYLRGESVEEEWQVLDIDALLDSMTEDAKESGRDVTLTGTAQPIMSRPLTLRRALSNLIENALRYGHKAAISLSDTAEMLVIEIRDEGKGIPPDKINTVFEPFVRLESSRNKAYGGVGLGLSIAREATRQCGGDLTLRNAAKGGLIAAISIRRES
ncbi:MAG: ATP-binding protein [Burkholderiaceae bacterium]|nr:ATP-binding protein [Burkholderiaceae bacterium]